MRSFGLLSSKSILKLFPESSGELCSTIRNDRLRHAMETNNLI
jgi:hypothetical protein